MLLPLTTINADIDVYRSANATINARLQSVPRTGNATDTEADRHTLLFLNNVYDSAEIDSAWIYGRVNLFGTSLYYAQNGDDAESAAESDEEIMKVKMAKAYLWLHTIPFDYMNISAYPSFFRRGDRPTGGIEAVPYLYLVFLGALLWRNDYYIRNQTDPIRFPLESAHPYLSPDKTLLVSTSSGYKMLMMHRYDTYVPLPIASFIDSDVDTHIMNELIRVFGEFVETTWTNIEQMFEPVIVDNATHAPRPVYLDDFSIVASTASAYLSRKQCRELNRLCFSEGVDVGNGRFILTNTRFGMILPYDQNNVMLMMFKTDELMGCITDIYKMPCYVLTTGFVGNGHPTVTGVSKNFAKSYIDQFASALDMFSMESIANEKAGYPVDSRTKQLRDFHVAMYMYFKNLWDKWLNGYYYSNESVAVDGKPSYLLKDSFLVRNYFSHFLFMDSFYRNIFKKLKLNCETLYQHYANRTHNYNMFSYLGSVASSHQCMFLSIPDYINLGDDDDTVAEKNLADLFRPMPANSMPPPQTENKFVVMYTHQPSSVTTVDKSDFRVDSFDIWSENDAQNVEPLKVFQKSCGGKGKSGEYDDYSQINRYGYNVPAFGIAYSRQSNSIFKSIKASMDNPVMTEQAVLAMGAIAELGNSTDKKVCFYGQDIYPIYSNYSYIIEVEMMGNAQIQPLMYFQLMNIPMYRGTYMIISVSHNMTQGDMTTTVRATKMSKYATPFVSNWFTVPPDEEGSVNGRSIAYSSQLTAEDGTVMDVTDCKFANTIKDVYGTRYEWGGKSVETGFDCSGFTRYVYRKAYDLEITSSTLSQLNTFRKMSDDGTATLVKTSIVKKNHDELTNKAVCGDILFLGYEGNPHIQHVALYMGRVGGKQYIAESSGGKDRHEPGVVCRDTVHSSLSEYEVKYIGHYNHTPNNAGCSLAEGGGQDDTFRGTLTTVEITDKEREANGYNIMNRLVNKGFVLNGINVKLTPMQAAAIAGVWFQESRWNPQSVNPSSHAYGLAQWLGTRKYDNYRAYCKEKGLSGGNDATAMKTIGEQMAYAEWEFDRTYFKDTCHLWGADASYTNRYGWKCGNLMVYRGDMEYSDAKLYDLVYRFTVAYEDGNAPARGEFAVQNRANYAKTAYELYTGTKASAASFVNYPSARAVAVADSSYVAPTVFPNFTA